MSEQRGDRKAVEEAVQSCYSTWGTSYYKDYYGPDAPYPPVHVDLLRQIVVEAGATSLLDAGCGPASFLRHLADDRIDLYGFDLTTEMVAEARRIFAEKGLDPAHVWEGSVLDNDAFSPRAVVDGPTAFDAAVCVGVLPHIAPEDDATVFANLQSAVRPGGTVVVEARNQLFGLFTLNRPSYEFLRDELIRANDLLEHAGDARASVENALNELKQQFRMDLPPIRRGKAGEPGYDEVVSRTHNPLTLKPQFEHAGFDNVRVLFYHYHALPPRLSGEAPALFRRASVEMERPDDWRGHFMASAFFLVGERS